MVMLFLGTIFIILFTDLKAISPTSKKITVTFHQYQKSWNQAQEVCENLGGTLYTEDSPEKAAVLARYLANWNDTVSYVWIGLHAPDIGGSYTWVYGKPSCQAIGPSIYSNWQSGETLVGAKRCAHHILTDNEWSVDGCKKFRKFVCERQESTSCTFSEITGTPKSSLSDQYETQTFLNSDVTTCRNVCLSSVHNDLNCWVATYHFVVCILYYMADPFLFTDSANIDSSSRQLFLKDCYTSDTDTTDDTTITTGNDDDPRMGCSGVATTTSSTTTASSTAVSSTTISSTTVSSTTISSTTPSSTSSTIPSVTSVGFNSTSSSSVTNSLSTSTSSTGISQSSAITISPGSSEMSVSSTSVAPTTAVSTVLQTISKCACLCNDLKTLYRNVSIDPEFANLTSEEILEKIIEKLRVNKSTLSATIRKKTSATDNRPSSVSVGAIAVVLIATVFGLLVAGDGVKLATYVVQKINSFFDIGT